MNDNVKPATFSSKFMYAYAGAVMKSPVVAISEIIANSWDAGGENIHISWPEKQNGVIEIADDGKGMTYNEFMDIWPTASYDRNIDKETTVRLTDNSIRKTFGKNGIGRFGMFYFSEEYEVETWRDGESNTFRVALESSGESPYYVEFKNSCKKDGHGTKIRCIWNRTTSSIIDRVNIPGIIKSRFYAANLFRIYVNDEEIPLEDFKYIDEQKFYLKDGRPIVIRRCEIKDSRFKSNIIWRVIGRPVYESSWKKLKYRFDERRDEIRQYFLFVDADFMEEYVAEDWSGFNDTEISINIQNEIYDKIEKSLEDVIYRIKQGRKTAAVKENLSKIRMMSSLDQELLGEAIQEILDRCPTMSGTDLINVVSVLTTMEGSKSKYNLLEVLSEASHDDFDQLNEILHKWSIRETKIVFDELSGRIEAINKLREVVNDSKTLELGHLHPIFERNLWIFGPEYDTTSFTSNESISTVLFKLFGKKYQLKLGSLRPDIVLTAGSSIGVYAADGFDYLNGYSEPNGYSKILIVELKRGGSKITRKDMNQASEYASVLEESGQIYGNPTYYCYVLGTSVEKGAQHPIKQNNMITTCISYDGLLGMAEARLMGIVKKIKDVNKNIGMGDETIKKLIEENPQLDTY